MKSKFHFIDEELERLRKEDLYRQLKEIKINGSKIKVKNKICLNLCSNDYLGIKSPKLTFGQNQSSSRLVAGNDQVFRKLEQKLAKHKSHQNSLIFSTGYMTNIGVISTLANSKNDHILSDEFNHASIIEACKLSDARVSIYKHNDIDDMIKKSRIKTTGKTIVITEGVFSMDGDSAKLSEITETAQQKGFITILDDAHGDFVVGNDGKGTAKLFDVEEQIDFYISSLSKGLGSFGGYVATENKAVELLVNKSKSFIYTSALPSVIAQDALKRFESNREKQRIKLEKNTLEFRKGLNSIGYKIESKSHIIPIIIGESKKAMEFGDDLLCNNIYAQPIRYPTVPKNKARIRLSITASLSKDQLEYALDVLEKIGKRFGII